jgi:alcohol dehydrogenase class IV
MRFEFATSNRIVFGNGIISEVPALAASLGQRVLVVADSSERCKILLEGLVGFGLVVVVFEVKGEPCENDVLLAMRIIQESNSQVLIGFGGGAALDTGKATAILMTNPGKLLDYIEVLGAGRTLENPSLPYIAIPTTAGTGSEVTRNAVITIPGKHVKASLRSPFMLPRMAVIDPELTYSLPASITANTGMDALTQLIEPFVCNSPAPLTDALCRDGIARVARSLNTAYTNGRDASAREDMALASLFGGLALANARLGAVHGMANPIGGMSHAPHGAICARLLPLVMEANLRALRRSQPNSPTIARYTEIACILTGSKEAHAEEGVAWVGELCKSLNIRPLSDHGLKLEDFPAIVEQSQKANSMKGNPMPLTDVELRAILVAAS